jgi:hypothetical protein
MMIFQLFQLFQLLLIEINYEKTVVNFVCDAGHDECQLTGAGLPLGGRAGRKWRT